MAREPVMNLSPHHQMPRPRHASFRYLENRRALLAPLLFLLLNACTEPPPQPPPPPPERPPSRIVVFMVDRSGSFHKVQREGNFKNQDYFYLACDQIKQYVEKHAGTDRELIIVRTIETASFTDETVAAQIDLTNADITFSEKEPDGVYQKYEHEGWEKRRAAFLLSARDQIASQTKSFYEKVEALRKRDYSDGTDIVNAFRALVQDLKSLPNYPKRIVVFSDFKDNQSRLDKVDVIDFGGDVEIEGRFVSINDLKPADYDKLIKAWQRILNYKVTEFKTPIKSIQ